MIDIITGIFFVFGIIAAGFTLYIQGQYVLGKISASLWIRTTVKASILLLAVLCVLLTLQDIIPLS